ncbi:hypothetical protein HU200_062027 [Digitaria exilis]|uniref:DNA polymerase delta subunit 4 n=1 Tax=Digitaria exilis TaxID=1010633 RepID=A0A835DXK6_9POAL|nr:hypothetical protein HU200_062027 [Digitaria exilis]
MAPARRGGLKGVYRQRKKAKPAPRKKQPSKDGPQQQQQQQGAVVASAAGTGEAYSAEEEALRQFDMDASYGPCIGVARLRRWDRAAAMGLRPPPHVRDLIILRRHHQGGGGGPSDFLLTGPPMEEKNSDECLWAGKV